MYILEFLSWNIRKASIASELVSPPPEPLRVNAVRSALRTACGLYLRERLPERGVRVPGLAVRLPPSPSPDVEQRRCHSTVNIEYAMQTPISFSTYGKLIFCLLHYAHALDIVGIVAWLRGAREDLRRRMQAGTGSFMLSFFVTSLPERTLPRLLAAVYSSGSSFSTELVRPSSLHQQQ